MQFTNFINLVVIDYSNHDVDKVIICTFMYNEITIKISQNKYYRNKIL